MATYSGNIYGERAYFVFDRTLGTGGTATKFLTAIPVDGTTAEYVLAGGASYASISDLQQYIGNVAYLNYTKKTSRKLSSLDVSGGITTTISTYTPDPRIMVGIFASGDSGSFTGNHMDEIYVTQTSGATFQAFLGRLTYPEQNPSIPTGYVLVDLVAYGTSGSDASEALYQYIPGGSTMENKINGVTATIKTDRYIEYIKPDSYRANILGQVGNSLDNSGITGVTIGTGANAKLVFFYANNKYLIDYVSRLLPAFANGGSGASGTNARQSNIFTILAGTSGDYDDVASINSPVFGVTLNAITGGTLGNSEFEEFAHQVLHSYAGVENNKGSIIYNINSKKNIRDIDEVSF